MATEKSFLKKYWLVFVSAGILVCLVITYLLVPDFQKFVNRTWSVLCSKNENLISRYFKGFSLWGPCIFVLMMVLQVFLIFFPSLLMMLVAVLGYGPVWGGLLSLTATLIASTLGFFLGKSFEGKAKIRLIGEQRYRKWQEFIQRYGVGSVVLFRISPFVSNDAISILAGVVRMGYLKFIAATMAGTLPLVAAVAWFGRDIENLKTGMYWIGGGGILVYLIYIWLDSRNNSD